MIFDVYVQGQFYKTLSVNNEADILKIVTQDTLDKSIYKILPNFDINSGHAVEIKPHQQDAN